MRYFQRIANAFLTDFPQKKRGKVPVCGHKVWYVLVSKFAGEVETDLIEILLRHL